MYKISHHMRSYHCRDAPSNQHPNHCLHVPMIQEMCACMPQWSVGMQARWICRAVTVGLKGPHPASRAMQRIQAKGQRGTWKLCRVRPTSAGSRAFGPKLCSASSSAGSRSEATKCVARPASSTSTPAHIFRLPPCMLHGITHVLSHGTPFCSQVLANILTCTGQSTCREVRISSGAKCMRKKSLLCTLQPAAGEAQVGAQVARQQRQEVAGAHVREQADAALWHGKHRPARKACAHSSGTACYPACSAAAICPARPV